MNSKTKSAYARVAAATLAASVFLWGQPSAHATTLAELQTQIQQLLAKIAVLQQQSAVGSGTIVVPGVTDSVPILQRNLFKGAKGNDVIELQKLLKQTGDFTYSEFTTYYGSVTERAVKKFQCRELNVCSGSTEVNGYGAVGPKTRRKLAETVGQDTQNTQITVYSTSSTSYAQAAYSAQGEYPPPATTSTAAACIAPPPEERTQPCTAPYTGTVAEVRYSICGQGASVPTWGVWQTLRSTCATPSSGTTARALAALPTNSPDGVLDTDAATYWNSGGYAPQWIEVDLGGHQQVSTLTLEFAQSPAGISTHQLYAGSTENPTSLVKTVNAFTEDQEEMVVQFVPPLTNVRYLRIVTTESPSWVAWRTIRASAEAVPMSVVKALRTPHVQQFGYYYSAGVGANAIDAVAPFTNSVWVGGTTVSDIVQKVQEAHVRRLGAVLAVTNFFFDPEHPSQLYPGDNSRRFAELWGALAPYQQSIKAFYVIDEPFLNSIGTGVSDVTLKNAINAVATHLHLAAPGIPTMAIFSSNEAVRPEFFSELLPGSVDWIGFDCYLSFGEACTEQKVRNLFSNFLAQKSPEQKIILVPDAYWGSAPDAATDERIAARARLYQEFAASTPEVVGIYPFLYHTEPTSQLWGAVSLPRTKALLRDWYHALGGY